MRKGEKFLMELAPTLNLDGTPDTGYFTQVLFMMYFVINLFPYFVHIYCVCKYFKWGTTSSNSDVLARALAFDKGLRYYRSLAYE